MAHQPETPQTEHCPGRPPGPPPPDWRHPVATSSSPSAVSTASHNAGFFSVLTHHDTEVQEDHPPSDKQIGDHDHLSSPAPAARADSGHNLTEGGKLGHPRSLRFWILSISPCSSFSLCFIIGRQSFPPGSGPDIFGTAPGCFASILDFASTRSPISWGIEEASADAPAVLFQELKVPDPVVSPGSSFF